jgi:hypothetical protein
VALEKYLRQKGAATLKAQGQAVPVIDPSDPDEFDMQMIEQHGKQDVEGGDTLQKNRPGFEFNNLS